MQKHDSDRDRQWFETAAELAADGLIILDRQFHFQFVSRTAAELLGYDRDEMLSLSLEDILPYASSREFSRLVDRSDQEAGAAQTERLNIRPAWDREFEVELTVTVAGPKGEIFFTIKDIGLSGLMEKEQAKSNQFLRSIVMNSADAIIACDISGHVLLFNQGACRMLGYREEEVIGRKKMEDFLEAGTIQEVMIRLRRDDPRDGPACLLNPLQVNLVHRQGLLFPAHISASSIFDDGQEVAVVAMFTDLRERVAMEQALRETRDYLNAIVENTPDMILTTDLDGCIESFNRGAERILGYRRQEVIGRKIEELNVEPEEMQALSRVLADRETSVSYETQLAAAGGRVVDVDLTLSHLRDIHGDIIGTVGISRDITEIKRVESELERKKAELEEAQLQVMHSEKMASLGKLAVSVAHEINNPLGGILLFCEMILEDLPEDHTIRPDLNQIRDQTLRCRDIVKGLMEFGRLTGTHYTFIDLNYTLEQSLALFVNQALFQNISLVKEYDPDLPQILGDASQLLQVFTNLIINAVDAMNERGTLTIRTAALSGTEEVRITFIDTGRGMERETLSRIFEPFFTTKPVGDGLGLGLSTSYGIIKRHGGRLEVESQPGQGAVFNIFLPLEQMEPE